MRIVPPVGAASSTDAVTLSPGFAPSPARGATPAQVRARCQRRPRSRATELGATSRGGIGPACDWPDQLPDGIGVCRVPSAQSVRQWLMLGLCWFSPAWCPDEPETDACTEAASELYRQRIEPILTSDEPSSCNQCHLSGVDLSLFVRDTPCETMACLIERDLVNLEAPEDSTVLSSI